MVHLDVGAAQRLFGARMQSTAAKLAASASSYIEQDESNAANLNAVAAVEM